SGVADQDHAAGRAGQRRLDLLQLLLTPGQRPGGPAVGRPGSADGLYGRAVHRTADTAEVSSPIRARMWKQYRAAVELNPSTPTDFCTGGTDSNGSALAFVTSTTIKVARPLLGSSQANAMELPRSSRAVMCGASAGFSPRVGPVTAPVANGMAAPVGSGSEG